MKLERLLRNAARHCRKPVPNMGEQFAQILDDVADDLKGVECGRASLASFAARYGLAANENRAEIEADGYITVER